jgi:hypothetical protein
MERNSELFSLTRNGLEQSSELFSLPRNGLEQNSKSLLLFLFHGTEFRVVLSSAEWFRAEFREFSSIYVPCYRILSIFLLYGGVRNRITRVFSFAEHTEFRRNKPIVPSIPSSAEKFFGRILATLTIICLWLRPEELAKL